MIEIENLDQFCAQLERFADETEEDWSRDFSKFAQKVFMAILETSPQWSGNFTANWSISTGSSFFTYSEYSVDETGIPGWRGDPEAIAEAMDRNAAFMQNDYPAHIRDTVWISNSTPYGEIIATNSDPDNHGYGVTMLRPGNFINPAPIPIGHVLQIADELWWGR